MKRRIAIAAVAAVSVAAGVAAAAFSTATVTVGAAPSAVAVNPLTNKIYVMNETDKTVTVIDGATNQTKLAALAVLHKRVAAASLQKAAGQTSPPHGVAVNPATNRIYVTNFGSANVIVLDGATDSAIATVATGANPSGIAVNVATNKIYVANYGNLDGTTVTVIDGATNQTVTVTAGTGPKDIEVNPVTNKIYVTNEFSYFLTVIDGATNQATNVPTTDQTFYVGVNPVTNKVFVSGYYYFTMLDGRANTTDTTFKIWFYPRTLGVNVTTNMVYVNNADGSGTTIFNATSKQSTGLIATGVHPVAVGINPVTNKVFVPSQTTPPEAVSIYDGNANQTSSVAAGSYATGLAINPVTDKVYVTNSWANNVTVISETSVVTPSFASTIVPEPGLVTMLARPPVSGGAVNALRPAHAALWEIRAGKSTCPFASWGIASIVSGAGTDSMQWNWPWGGDSLLPGENFVWVAALDSQAVSASLPAGSAFGANVAVCAIYRVDTMTATRAVLPHRTAPTLFVGGAANAVRYTVTKTCFVDIRCYDPSGRQVATLVNALQQPGSYTVSRPRGAAASGAVVMVAKVGSDVYRQLLLSTR